MSGFRVSVAPEHEQGYWEGTFPGRRYQIWLRRNPHLRKRLCLARMGTGAWFAATNTRYSVIVMKNYAGSTTAILTCHTPWFWGLLNRGGIFAETIEAQRSRAEYGFAKYRYLGFTPMLAVESDGYEPLGFGQGLWLFQKTRDGKEGDYLQRQRELDAIFADIAEVLEPVIIYHRTTLNELVDEGDALLSNYLKSSAFDNWDAVSASAAFADWLLTRIRAHIPRELVLDLLRAAGLRDERDHTSQRKSSENDAAYVLNTYPQHGIVAVVESPAFRLSYSLAIFSTIYEGHGQVQLPPPPPTTNLFPIYSLHHPNLELTTPRVGYVCP